MNDAEGIKAAIIRSEDRIRARPAIGRLTISSTARIRGDLTCKIEDESWKLTADMRKSLGDRNQGPDPGVFDRAAISSCLAIGYAVWFARMDIPLNAIDVEINADFNYGGVLGVSDVAASYSEFRYAVTVDSPAAEAEIIEVLDWAGAHSPWLSNTITVSEPRRSVQITSDAESD